MINPYANSIGIMFPVKYPPVFPRPVRDDLHVTVMYLGEYDDINFTKDEVLSVMSNLPHGNHALASVTGLDWFGPEADVPVLRLKSQFLNEFRDKTKAALAAVGIEDASAYANAPYKPHVTIDRDTADKGVFPSNLFLSPVELWWRDEVIVIS